MVIEYEGICSPNLLSENGAHASWYVLLLNIRKCKITITPSPLLDSMVAANQSAFIRGRCIHDNFMLVQKTIKVLHYTAARSQVFS